MPHSTPLNTRRSMAARVVYGALAMLGLVVLARAEKVDVDELKAPRLSHTSVLLPPYEEGDYSTVRLHGYNGCFEWTTKNPSLISAEPMYEVRHGKHCSTHLKIKSLQEFSGRRSTFVTAREVDTGVRLRCEVFIDKVHRLQLVQNTHMIYLESYAEATMQGYDMEGNMFSTLNGLEFKWDAQNRGEGTSTSMAAIMGYQPRVTLHPDQADLSILGARGVAVGLVEVTGTCLTCLNKNLRSSVTITVVESVSILPAPPPILIATGNPVQLMVERVRYDGDNEVLPIGAAHYTWRSGQEDIVSVNKNTGLAVGNRAGLAEVFLMDDRIADDRDSTTIEVTDPVDLSVAVQYQPVGQRNNKEQWYEFPMSTDIIYLTTGRTYLLQPRVTDAHSRPLRLTNETAVSVIAPKTHVWEKKRTMSPDVKTLGNAGTSQVDVAAVGAVAVQIGVLWHSRGAPNLPLRPQALSTQRAVRTCERVTFAPLPDGAPAIRLPWVQGVEQPYRANTTGGCVTEDMPHPAYSTADSRVASVSGEGLLTARGLGSTTVTGVANYDLYYAHNNGTRQVAVTDPAQVAQDQRWVLEVPMYSERSLLLTYLNPTGQRYHNCSELQRVVDWTVTGTTEDGKPVLNLTVVPVPSRVSEGGVCASAVVKGLAYGTARVDAILQAMGAPLMASWTVTIFAPLCVEPRDQVQECGAPCAIDWSLEESVTMAVGAPWDLQMRGGPGEALAYGVDAAAKRTYDRVTATSELTGLDVTNTELLVTPIKPHGSRQFELLCIGIGNYTLKFDVTAKNTASAEALATTTLRVHCDIPARVVILQRDFAEPGKASPHELAAAAAAVASAGGAIAGAPTTVMNIGTYPLRAAVLGSFMQPMANTSIFSFEWALDRPRVTHDGGASHLTTLDFHDEMGLVKVFVKLVNMKLHPRTPSAMVRQIKAAMATREKALSDGCVLDVVAPLQVVPDEVWLAASWVMPVNLNVIGGSRHLVTTVDHPQYADVSLRGQTIEVLPKGRMGSTRGVLRDQVTKLEAEYTVHVTAPAVVKLTPLTTKCRMEEIVDVQVEVLDSRNHVLSPLSYVSMGLKAHMHDTRLDWVGPLNLTATQALIHVKCASPGVGSLHAAMATDAASGGKALRSNPAQIQVYEPVHLVVEDTGCAAGNVSVLVGATRVLAVTGGSGAQQELYWRFSSLGTEVLKVAAEEPCMQGLSPGSTAFVAEAVGSDGRVYGADELDVHVVELTGLKLKVQPFITVGHEMSATIVPDPVDECLDVRQMAQVCHTYKWAVDAPHVLGLAVSTNQYADPKLAAPACGTPFSINPGFTTRLTARMVGTAVVKVTVHCHAPSRRMKVFTLTETVRVLDTTPTLADAGCPLWLLPPKYTTVPLLPVGDAAASYHVMQSPGVNEATLMVDDAGRLVTGTEEDVACVRAAPRHRNPAHPGPPAVAACVRVAEVKQLTVGGVGGGVAAAHVADVSVGAAARFSVVMRDATAFPHTVGPSEHPGGWKILSSDAEHTDAKMEGDTLVVRTLTDGSLIVKVQSQADPEVSHYVVVQAGDYIQPRSPKVYAGAVLQFTVSADAGRGRWWSANAAVVKVDAGTGVAAAVGEGVTTLHYNGSKLSTYTTVSVVQVMSIAVARPAGEAVLTNVPAVGCKPPGSKEAASSRGGRDSGAVRYSFPVTFGDFRNQPLLPGGRGLPNENHVAFQCRLVPSTLGSVTPVSDGARGLAACEVTLHPPGSGAAGSNEVTMVEVVATLQNAPKSEAGAPAESRVAMPYVGGFLLAKGAPSSLRLTSRNNETAVELLGNTAAVQATWSQTAYLSVKLSSVRQARGGWFGSALRAPGGGAVFVLGVAPGAPSFVDTVVLSVPQTGQQVELRVAYGSSSGGSLFSVLSGGSGSSSPSPSLTVVLTLLLGAAGLYVTASRRSLDSDAAAVVAEIPSPVDPRGHHPYGAPPPPPQRIVFGAQANKHL